MSNFYNKTILSNQTIGDRLLRARLSQQLSLKEISEHLRIKKEYLEFLENGQYNKLPSPIFIKNYLKQYSIFLNLSWEVIDKKFQEEFIIYQQQIFQPISKKHQQRPLVIPKIFYGLTIFFVSLALCLYLIYEVSNIIQPPKLAVNNLPDQLVISHNNLELTGKTSRNSAVYINGVEVIVDEDGNFKEELTLQEGLNNITITAKKKHSKEAVILKKIFVNN